MAEALLLRRLVPACIFLLSAAILPAQESLPPLPQAVSNNAVAGVATASGFNLYSFFGLGAGKTHRDISRQGFALASDRERWQTLPVPPVSEGRLAAQAVTLGDHIYLFGGYTVAADHTEVSTPEVLRFDPDAGQYERLADMPVPTDDAVALVYQDRYVYLISGWHDVGNINLVQVLDTRNNRWQQATPYPGTPVFGHAGGMVGSDMVICDGVKIDYPASGPRQFLPSAECWQGRIRADDHRRIDWRPLPAHPGPPRYRMAAVGGPDGVVFVGGSTNPYNYDGIGYNGEPSAPESMIFSIAVGSDKPSESSGGEDPATAERAVPGIGVWRCHGQAPAATMDHRGLLRDGQYYYLVGGMLADQQVTDRVWRFPLPPVRPCA